MTDAIIEKMDQMQRQIDRLTADLDHEKRLRHLLAIALGKLETYTKKQGDKDFEELNRHAVGWAKLTENWLREHQIILDALMIRNFPKHVEYENAITDTVGNWALHSPPSLDNKTRGQKTSIASR